LHLLAQHVHNHITYVQPKHGAPHSQTCPTRAFLLRLRAKFALANPPLRTAPPDEPEAERVLTITGVKTRRNRGGAHVVTCFLDSDQFVEYVAKTYDGVDYPMGSRNHHSLDCMTWADGEYSIEATAYQAMQPTIGGKVVPAYFGSWTFALDTNRPGQQRWVRMILIELVKGECMLDIIARAEVKSEGEITVDYSLLPPEDFRIRVLRNILESDLAIWWEAALEQNDLDPRNVIVKPDGSVVLFDFNQAHIWGFTIRWDLHPKQRDPKSLPTNPIQRYWPLPCGFADSEGEIAPWADWIPRRWIEDKNLAAEWLIQTYRDSPKFAPLDQWWLDWDLHGDPSPKVWGLLESLGRKSPCQAPRSFSR